jgi:competence protein ComEC
MRDLLLDRIRLLSLPEEEFAVAAALVLGTTDYLEGDLTQAFVASGTIHVLCVSGLHIAIVYLLVSSFFGFLRYQKWQVRLRSMLSLAAVWGYTIVTGSGPSSLRAAAMFTIFQAGVFAGRRNDIFNSFCISAFLLLIIYPHLLWDIGFQLSYFAVAGIITFYKEFSEWWKPSRWLVRKLYELAAIALGAQLATLPVSLYYFHQFPSYFLPINMFAVPLTTFTLQVAVIYLFVSGINFLVKPFEIVLAMLIRVLIISVSWVEDLPGSLIMIRYLTFYEVVLIFIFIWLMYMLFKDRNYWVQVVMIGMMILFSFSGIINKRFIESRRSILVYNSREATLLSLTSVKDNFMIIKVEDDSLKNKVINRYSRTWNSLEMQNNVIVNHDTLNEFSSDILFSKSDFIQFHDKKILMVSDSSKFHEKAFFPDSLDLIIITGIPRYHKPQQIFTSYPTRQVVISATCKPWLVAKCDTVCRELDIPCHIISKSGAYNVSF